jgi:crotonobetainyl-CoA:carnitine CoA-transferase CaiB-like acyl-CoA transferase
MVIDVEDGLGGMTRGLGSPVVLNGTVAQEAISPAPHIGEHTVEILEEFGFEKAEISHLRETKTVFQS